MLHRKTNSLIHRALETLEQRLLFAAGVLDPSFNFTGTRTLDVRFTDIAAAVAFQLDNRSIVVGSAENQIGNSDALITRFNTDGTLDTTFGTAGAITLNLGGDEIATGVAVQPTDGRILVLGTVAGVTANSDFFLARFNTDGTLDTTFNSTGTEIIDFGGADVARALAVTSTGRIIAVGASSGPLATGMAIAFINPDGTLDITTGTGLVVTNPGIGLTEQATGIALDPVSGGFVVSGFQEPAAGTANFMVAKFTAAGILDPTFGGGGRAIANFGQPIEMALDVAVDPSTGSIVAVGPSANGTIALPPGVLAVTNGTNATQSRFAIARFTPAGGLDQTFNATGLATQNIFVNNVIGIDVPTSVDIQTDGNIVVGGSTLSTNTGFTSFAMIRLTSPGALDTSFGFNGQTVVNFGTSSQAFATRLQPDGKIFQAGTVDSTLGGTDIALARFLNDTTVSTGPAFSINSISVVEGNVGLTPAVFTVTLNPSNQFQTTTVNFTTVDGTAISNVDFVPTSGVLTFAPGVTTQTITVPVIANFNTGPNKMFSVLLSSPTNASIALAQGNATITNDDGIATGAVTISQVTPGTLPATIVGGESNARGTMLVTVINNNLQGAASGPLLVQLFATQNGIITPTDTLIGSVTRNINLAAGKSQTIRVPIRFPAVAQDSTFMLVAQTSGVGPVSVNAATAPVAVQSGVVTIAGSPTPLAPMDLRFGRAVNLRFPLTNMGNARARARLSFTVQISDPNDPTHVLFTIPINGTRSVTLNPGQTKNSRIRIRLPKSNTALLPGNFLMQVQLVNSIVTPANTTNGTTVATFPVSIM